MATTATRLPRVRGVARARAGARRPRRGVAARAWRKKDDDEIWDEDERRRIEENKKWRRTDDPSEAWDIDKERDALMYKRESLEAMLRLECEDEDGGATTTDADGGDADARRDDA